MIQAIRGTKDILPGNSHFWQFVENKFRTVSLQYGFKELRTPIFEKTELFSRGVGEETDIVNKEMYTFEDRGHESLTLRPEGTAPIVRSIIENSLLQQGQALKVWYFGPYFRYERPQKGRLRQFHQYGAECVGSSTPESDAEIILLANAIIKSIGINDYKFLINTLGSDESRLAYRKALIEYLSSKKDGLSEDSCRRLEINPLRILDSKEKGDIDIVAGAPIILDYLDEQSRAHFEQVKHLLDSVGITYIVSPKLVRGLDYYNHIVFEFQHKALGAQDSFGGGGRYNELFRQLGGKETPAIGFALGVERLLLVLEGTGSLPKLDLDPNAYIVNTNPSLFEESQKIAELLRQRGYKIILDIQRRSVKAQLREANKLNALFTIILGEDELKSKKVIVKKMADSSQEEVLLSDLENFRFD